MTGQGGGKPNQREEDPFQGSSSAFLQDELCANYNVPMKPQAQWPVMTQH